VEIWLQMHGPQTREGKLPELSPCSYHNCCFSHIEWTWRRLDSVELNCMMLLRYAGAC